MGVWVPERERERERERGKFDIDRNLATGNIIVFSFCIHELRRQNFCRMEFQVRNYAY